MSEHLREEDFIQYLDGRLNEAARAELDRHLAACADCRGRVDELRGVMGVLGEWQAAGPSPRFDAALRARLAEEPASAPPWFAWRPAYAAGLAAGAVVALGVFLGPPAAPGPARCASFSGARPSSRRPSSARRSKPMSSSSGCRPSPGSGSSSDSTSSTACRGATAPGGSGA